MHVLKRIVKILDNITLWLARLTWWLVFPLMAVLAYEVIVRKLFVSPTIWAMDISYMLNGILGMTGAVYALYKGGHIAIDFISDKWRPRTQAALNTIFYITCFFPGVSIFLWFAWQFAYESWLMKERAITSAWMAPIYPLKMIMAVAMAFLILQGISEFLKNLYVLLRGHQL
ncbi:MAG: TRAP transporter small permease subunit [Deltaproteobacteria bacterium]|nr:TRAP transporter small permease subunit [Deltaproteobacteria bacterium]MCF8118601.1 TRAP transporter small permease subunit [Deltaproteobacteria bacterium]